MSILKKKPFGLIAAAIVALNLIGAYFLVPPMQPMRAQLGAVQTWAGNATGTNSVTISVHNIAQTSDLLGVAVRFLPAAINTSSVTITINLDSGGTLGPINVLKPSSGSLISFVGGEFQAGQIAQITYDGTQFECSTCTQAVAPGTTADYSGVVVPAGWLKADGSAVSRTGQPGLFSALVISGVSATTTNTNTSVIVASSSNYQVGWFVGGTNVVCNSTITSIPDGTHIVLSSGATGSGAATLTIGPYPQGDCSTTFNIPNYIGKVTAGVDGTTNITSTTCTNPASIGDKQTQGCGSQTVTLATANLPPYTPSGTIQAVFNNPVGPVQTGTGGPVNIGGSGSGGTVVFGNATVNTFFGNAQGGSSTPFSKQPSTSLVYKIIKT